MEPLGFLLGVATFNTLVKCKKPLRKAAVIVTTQLLGAADRLRTTAYELKEEFEDIVAEAQYENMRKVVGTADAVQENEGLDRKDRNGKL